MTIKLSSVAVDRVLEEEGDWIDFPEWPAVAFKVSSIHKRDYMTARDLMLQGLSRRYPNQPVPPDVRTEKVGTLFCEHLLHGWRGFDIAYSPETARATLTDPAYRQMLNAIEWCAGKVGLNDLEFTAAETKN